MKNRAIVIDLNERPFSDPDEAIPFVMNLLRASYGNDVVDGFMGTWVGEWLLNDHASLAGAAEPLLHELGLVDPDGNEWPTDETDETDD